MQSCAHAPYFRAVKGTRRSGQPDAEPIVVALTVVLRIQHTDPRMDLKVEKSANQYDAKLTAFRPSGRLARYQMLPAVDSFAVFYSALECHPTRADRDLI